MRINNINQIKFNGRKYLEPTKVISTEAYKSKDGYTHLEKKYYYDTGDVIYHTRVLNGNLTTFLRIKPNGHREIYQTSGQILDIPNLIKPYEKT